MEEAHRLRLWIQYGVEHDVELHIVNDPKKRRIWKQNVQDLKDIREEVYYAVREDPPSLRRFERILF